MQPVCMQRTSTSACLVHRSRGWQAEPLGGLAHRDKPHCWTLSHVCLCMLVRTGEAAAGLVLPRGITIHTNKVRVAAQRRSASAARVSSVCFCLSACSYVCVPAACMRYGGQLRVFSPSSLPLDELCGWADHCVALAWACALLR